MSYEAELHEDLIQEVRDYVEYDIKNRLYDKNGGVDTDYANFCTNSDMNWIREEFDGQFMYILDYIQQPDSMSEEEFEEQKNSYEIGKLVEEEKRSVFAEIDEIEDNLGTHKIYNHIVNEVEYRMRKPEDALKNLEDKLIENRVVYDIEELEEIEEYQEAKAYVASKSEDQEESKAEDPKEKESSYKKDIKKFNKQFINLKELVDKGLVSNKEIRKITGLDKDTVKLLFK